MGDRKDKAVIMKHMAEELTKLTLPFIFACDFNANESMPCNQLFFNGKVGKKKYVCPALMQKKFPELKQKYPDRPERYLTSEFLLRQEDSDVVLETESMDWTEEGGIAMNTILNDAYARFKNRWPTKFTVAKWRKGGDQKDKLGIAKENIDYILPSKEWITTNVLDMPTFDEIKKATVTLNPSWRHPSDHMMLGAELLLQD